MPQQNADRVVGRGGIARHVVRAVTAVEKGLAVVALCLIFLLVLTQALQRYLPVEGWAWTGELARFSLVWLTFVAAGALVAADGHIALQVLDNIPSPVAVRVIHVAANVMVALIAALLVRECWTLIAVSDELRSASLRMPMSWHYVLPLLGFVSTMIRSAAAAVTIARHGVGAGSDEPSMPGAEGEVPA